MGIYYHASMVRHAHLCLSNFLLEARCQVANSYTYNRTHVFRPLKVGLEVDCYNHDATVRFTQLRVFPQFLSYLSLIGLHSGVHWVSMTFSVESRDCPSLHSVHYKSWWLVRAVMYARYRIQNRALSVKLQLCGILKRLQESNLHLAILWTCSRG